MERNSFLIYDASAGSGKTYALVKEYLKIILLSPKNDAYRNILAITFTNKAVHEMKSRIVGSLSEFVKDNPSTKAEVLMGDLAKETKLPIKDIKAKAQQIIKHIIHNYAAFDISTIDKFTHKVIRAFAHDLNLPMTFEVSLDTENLLVEAIDAIIAQAGTDATLTKLLLDFTLEKTDDDKSWDISREIMDVGRLVLNENNRNEISQFHDKTIGDFLAIKKHLKTACDELDKVNSQLAQTALGLIEEKGIDLKSFSRGTFPNHLISIRDEKYNSSNKKYHTAEDIVIIKAAKDRDLIENIIPDLLQTLELIYKNFGKRDFYTAFLRNITPLSLLNTVNKELEKIQEDQNVLSISEFNAIIHREIQNQPAPFIYERLGERYRHFFIDEFQDTSEMQWQNLIPLIDNALSGQDDYGNKGTLMIVGDPKQSIYRWRGGKAEQFIELSKEENSPFSNRDHKIEHLETNYRSYSQIIEFNNEFFKLLSSEFENPDYRYLYEHRSHQNTTAKSGGYVNISFIPKDEVIDIEDREALDKSDLYGLATINSIEKVLQEGFQYSDVVILVRKRDQGIAIANYLTENNIPILSSETLMINNSTEVQLIINLLRYLKNNADLESKAHFLYHLAQNNQDGLEVHDFISKGMQFNKEVDFENWLVNYGIGLSFQNIRKKSLYEAVEIIVSKFLSVEASAGNAYVQYFLDIVLERDIRNQAGVADFLDFWEKNAEKFSIPSPEGNNAVKIMTIHRSKGLEFPVVIMPFAEQDYGRGPKDKLWINTDEVSIDLPKILIDNSKAVEGFGEEANLVYSQKKQEELLDNINVLYVALTRAEEQLFVISNMNLSKDGEPVKNNLSSFFINYLLEKGFFDKNVFEYEFGDKAKKSEGAAFVDNSKPIVMVKDALNAKNIKIAQREALMWGTKQQESIEYGNVIHEILSFVKTSEDVGLAIDKAIESGLINLLQKDLVHQTVIDIVNHEELAIFFEKGNEILNEKTIVQKNGKAVKPDRIVVKAESEVYLLDYKTGADNPKYKKQLEDYQEALNSMGYVVKNKALVFIGEKIRVVNL